MTRFENVRAVFFDVDDTLYDFERSMRYAFEHLHRVFTDVFSAHKVDEMEKAYWTFYRGVPEDRKVHLIHTDPDLFRRTMWTGALLHLGIEGELDATARVITDEMQRMRPEHWRLAMYEGADALLRELRPRMVSGATRASEASEDQAERPLALGVTAASKASEDQAERPLALGVITNGPGNVQRPKLEALRYREYFPEHLVFVSGEFGVRKPDPSIFLAAAKAAGVEPTECVMVGDAREFDMPAKAVGFRTILFTAARERPDVTKDEHPPDAIVASYREIRKLLLPEA